MRIDYECVNTANHQNSCANKAAECTVDGIHEKIKSAQEGREGHAQVKVPATNDTSFGS